MNVSANRRWVSVSASDWSTRITVWSAGARVRSRRSRYTQLSAPMIGRPHMSPTTLASNAMVTAPMPQRITMPRRSRLLRGTASALGLPLFSREFLPDVSFELAEVVVAPPYFRGAQALQGGVVLPGQVAEVFHGAFVRSRQAQLVLGDAVGGPD